MARPKRRIRWTVTVTGGGNYWWCPALRQWATVRGPRGKYNLHSHAHARSKRQAYRIARKAQTAGAQSVLLLFMCPRRTRKWPRGFTSDYVLE